MNLRYVDFPANYADLPTVSFVIPNQDHDLHDGATPVATHHYDVLRTLEDMYGLSHSGTAASAMPISEVWGSSPSSPAPKNPAGGSDGVCGALGLEGILLTWLGSRRGRGRIFRF